MTDYSEIKKLAQHHINLHGDAWHGEDSPALASVPTFAAEMFIAAASPSALLALIAQNEALRGLYQMQKETETREMRDLKAECEVLRKDAETAAKKLRSAEICHPRAVETLVDEAREALGKYLPEGWPGAASGKESAQ